MENIRERILEDIKSSMKSKDEFTRDTLRMVNAALKQVEIDKRIELKDADVIKILKGEQKKREDSIELYRSGGREDLAQKEQSEIDIIKKYLPKQLSDDDLKAEIKKLITSLSATTIKDLGKVMGASSFLSEVADGRRISQIAKELLSEQN